MDTEDSDDAQQDAVVFHTFDFQGQVLMDSGASSHMTGDATNLADVQAYQHAVVVVNGAKTHATKMGTMCVSASERTTLVMQTCSSSTTCRLRCYPLRPSQQQFLTHLRRHGVQHQARRDDHRHRHAGH
ncbi:hypothetical protein AaE_006709 [Aphanomyces astaci]|uniref:Retrovirus-related Pol polyprotein from transposon TNT 1-94-like beta-barrel domain-containing protein n=1 Tax=Aphanomyces astaci TaxID=112090 RepID=A0A6A5A4F8_APHAT|nr:hypothetical protein AaE_006709 [Aphanomyces astaci]